MNAAHLRSSQFHILALCAMIAFSAPAAAQTEPLSSWNDGPAKQAILAFVKDTTTQGSANFVPPAERIVTFDQDGTLWVEHPMYSQVMYCLEHVPDVVAKKPELKNVEPLKTVLSGNREAIAKLTMPDLMKILAATLTGMPVSVAAASFSRSGMVSLASAARSPFRISSTVEYGATAASSGFALTSAGTLSKTYITCEYIGCSTQSVPS